MRPAADVHQLADRKLLDRGRTLAHLASVPKTRNLEKLFDQVTQRLQPAEENVVVGDEWYTMRLLPYLTADRTAVLIGIEPSQ